MGFGEWVKSRRLRKDAAAASALKEMRHSTKVDRGTLVVHIVRVYQIARRGTKAVVEMDSNGRTRDAWFWYARVARGQCHLISASSGYGPHTNRDNVLYVGHEDGTHGILQTLSPRQARRALRFERARHELQD
jgi:hypothetical protein